MVEWEKFSVFGDVGELEHVSYLLELAAKENRKDLGDLIGENSYLVQKLNAQNKHSEYLIEQERPGLYPKTWMAHLFTGLYVLLDELFEAPQRLPDTLPRLLLDLHKVLIAAHDVFDPHHRELLLKSAIESTTANANRLAATKAACVRHDQAGGARDNKATALDLYASGTYGTTKDAAAEGIAAAKGWKFRTVRTYLTGAPVPDK